MTTQLTAVFDSREDADLALLRLRRNKIDYSVAELKTPERVQNNGFAASNIAPVYGLPSPAAVSASKMYSAVLGSRAVSQRTAAARGQTRLAIHVNSDQALHARAILCAVNGRIL